MTGLSSPWDLSFTPEGELLFTEKCKGLSIRKADGRILRLFGTAGSAVVADDFFCAGQSGMAGVVLDPDFASNRNLFVYMASNLKNPRTNRVVRLKIDEKSEMVSERMDIVTDIPFRDAGNNWGEAGAHSGGRLRFGPDAYLYVTTGDNHNGSLPQDLGKLGGKVLRIDRNGKAAPENNGPAGADPRIFTYGHRNVQGISFHPDTHQAYVSEHGPGHSDEVTALVAGGNAGWDPKPDAGVTCADNYCGYISNRPSGEPTSMTDLDKFPEAMKPVLTVDDSQGMGPCLFLVGSQWGAWEGHLLVGIMGGKKLSNLTVSDSARFIHFESVNGFPSKRIRSLVQDAKGSLFVATDEGDILKVVP